MQTMAESITRDKRDSTTVYEQITSRGIPRRDFLKFCAWMAACIGLGPRRRRPGGGGAESKRRLPVVWLHFQECTCCSESFLRSSHPIVADILLDKLSLDYTETLMAAAGHQAEACLHDTITKYKGEYVLCVEGSVPLGDDGVYCCIGGKTARQIVEESPRGRRRSSLGQLRQRGMRAGGQAQPHASHPHP